MTTPLEKWKKGKRKDEGVVVIKPAKTNKHGWPDDNLSARAWWIKKRRERGEIVAEPGMITYGSCPYHPSTRKVYNDALIALCLQCYPELDPEAKDEQTNKKAL